MQARPYLADASIPTNVEPRGPQVVSAIIVRAVAEALVQIGAAAHLGRGLASARIDRIDASHAVIPRAQFLAELEHARQRLGNPALGLVLGEALAETSARFIGPLVASQVSLRDTMTMFLWLSRTVLGGPRWCVAEEGDDLLVGYPFEPELGRGAELEAELGVTAVYCNLVCSLGSEGRRDVQAMFGFAAPHYVDRHRKLFGEHVRFSARLTGVRLPAAWLERSRDQLAWGDLSFGFRGFSERWAAPESESWSARVRQTFASEPSLSSVDFDQLAKRWGLSSRSLRRRLASENASLSTLLDEARLLRARDLLARGNHTLPQISAQLGYAEVNSFQRAFKRWAGTTPGSYRRSAVRERAAE